MGIILAIILIFYHGFNYRDRKEKEAVLEKKFSKEKLLRAINFRRIGVKV